MSSGQNTFTKGQSGELAWVTSSNIPSPLKWFLGPFIDFASSLYGSTTLKTLCAQFDCRVHTVWYLFTQWVHHISEYFYTLYRPEHNEN